MGKLKKLLKKINEKHYLDILGLFIFMFIFLSFWIVAVHVGQIHNIDLIFNTIKDDYKFDIYSDCYDIGDDGELICSSFKKIWIQSIDFLFYGILLFGACCFSTGFFLSELISLKTKGRSK